MTLTQLKYAIAVSKSSSMNEAAKGLFISQPSLSAAIKDLEEEIGLEIFMRTNRGIRTTPDGAEFLGYARQIVEQYQLMESRYINKENEKKRFSVSMQHYTFAVQAFMEVVRQYGMDDYEFAVYENRTADVIEDVKSFRSEVGVLYLNDFNRKVLNKIFADNELEFHELFDCHIYAFIHKEHPLAGKDKVTLEDLCEYPRLTFDQGQYNSFYYAEEVLSTYDYTQSISVNDRATMLNLIIGMNGYTLCSGIISEDLNGERYSTVRVDSDEIMTIGYIKRKGIPLSQIGQLYVEEIQKYKERVMD